jgi:hypothetical protein
MMPRRTVAGDAFGPQKRAPHAIDRFLVNGRQADVAEHPQDAIETSFVAVGTRRGLNVAYNRCRERVSGTTFTVPMVPEDLGVERCGLFPGQLGVVASSALAYALRALERRPGDPEPFAIFPARNAETAAVAGFGGAGHRSASSRARRATMSKRITRPLRKTGMPRVLMTPRSQRDFTRSSVATSSSVL